MPSVAFLPAVAPRAALLSRSSFSVAVRPDNIAPAISCGNTAPLSNVSSGPLTPKGGSRCSGFVG